jgi:UDPglucose 6-dehydrogenase
MKNIAVIGTGYVGLVTGACLAELGNNVVCVDTDSKKIAGLRAGKMPFFEPGLQELVARNARAERIVFATDATPAIAAASVVFIAVGTPMGEDGHADLQYVREAARSIACALSDGDHKVVVNKSTVPVETGDLVAAIIRESVQASDAVSVVSNPEFLREGSAISDFMQPDRIVIGVSDERSAQVMKELYAPLAAQIFVTDVRTAEMIKYTANAFLATKISFVNEIANICAKVGADVKAVVAAAGADSRIGTAFLNPGLGFGGSCFPKDLKALSKIAESYGVRPAILQAVLDVNERQISNLTLQLEELLGGLRGKHVAVFGLAFKPNTDDVRESPAIHLIESLIAAGARISAHDPEALETAREVLGDSVRYVANCYEAVHDADALVVATDWNEYKQIDFGVIARLMRGRTLLDGRNLYDAEEVRAAGFDYRGIGHGHTAGTANGRSRKQIEA